MIPFNGWREVGQAMRWARKQHGGALYHHTDRWPDVTETEWSLGDHAVIVKQFKIGRVHVVADAPKMRVDIDCDDARRILSVLSSVELLPITFDSAYRAGVGIGYRQGRKDCKADVLEICGEVTS